VECFKTRSYYLFFGQISRNIEKVIVDVLTTAMASERE